MKTVSVFYNGLELKQFTCSRADITGNTVNFYGVPRKRGSGTLSLFYCGELFTEIDHSARVARVIPLNEMSVEIVLTW